MSGFSHFHRALTLSGRIQLLPWLGVFFLAISLLVTSIASLSLQAFNDAPTPRIENGEPVLSINPHRETSPAGKQRTYTGEVLDGNTSSSDETSVILALTSLWPTIRFEPNKTSSLPALAEVYSPLLRHPLSPRAPPMS